MIRKAIIIIGIAVLGIQQANASRPPYFRILVPVYMAAPVSGAYGSLWASEFVVHNGSDRVFTISTSCNGATGCAGDVTTDEELKPTDTKLMLPPRYPAPANPVGGAVLWLVATGAPADTGDQLAYNLRVVDLSRTATAAGTEVPVLREADFHTGAVHLLNVPLDARFRVALRVFEMNLAHADFLVRVFDQSTNALLSEQAVTTTTGGVDPQGFTPAFAELDQLGGEGRSNRVRIDIVPVTPGVAFWSYVSITNNDSQQITLVTPQ